MTAPKSVRQNILDAAQLIVSHKGFSAVGLNEVLQAADVPKGSFYHYFGSKDAFGVALLDNYFESYLDDMRQIFQEQGLSESQKLLNYWQRWIDNQTLLTDSGKCLAVKLGAEVTDLSEPMRGALDRGTSRIIELLTAALTRGVAQGSVTLDDQPGPVALRLYALWLGASVMAKITRTSVSFDEAMLMTRKTVGVADHH